jgi:transposase InsO family protein
MIRAEKANFPIVFMCGKLGVSTSGYYAWEKRPESRRKRDDAVLVEKIRDSHRRGRGAYGSPRIYDDLKEQGETTGRHRIARLMRENGITARPLKRFRKTTDSNHNLPVAPNLLERNFKADKPDAVWVADITYVWTARGWTYLAVILDLFSRCVVGWSIDDNMRTELVLKALEMAEGQRNIKPGLIFHSDRGSQYASDEYRKALSKVGIVPSMSRKGDCWDNAVAESFFATIKRELVRKCYWKDLEAARMAIHEYIEVFYNRRRRHSTNGNLSPAEYERRFTNQAAVAA